MHNITNANIGALPNDFIGSRWRALYDANYLYILVEVKDAVVRVPDSGPVTWWEDDAVEVYLDGNNSKGTSYDANDFQYGFRYTDPIVHAGGNSAGGAGGTTGVTFSLQLITGGYTMEARIPWTTINTGAPFDGKIIGIDIAVNDDDNGGPRDGQIATYSSSDQAFTNPSFFGTNTLTVCIPAPLSILYTHTDPSCLGKTDGTIRVAGEGGEPPYTYRLDKTGPFLANDGYFPGLAPRTGYIVEVQDATGTIVPRPAEPIATIDIIEPVNPLTISNDTTVCAGSAVNLVAGGATQGYTWTFNTAANVANLSATNIANPVATPSATTTYTVTSQSSANLIPNPNFESGNVGFTSSYTYFNTQTVERKVYAITASPLTLDPYFSTCGDHTTGTGKMMVVDGSAFAVDTVWYQTVPVLPGTNYTFSYWIQTVATNSPAQIETRINGVMVPGSGANPNPVTAPATPTPCGQWKQVTYTWNSGASTSANIALYDRNIVGIGNDFALDDFYFNSVCPVTKDVTITVDPAPATPTTTTVQPTCTTPTGTITVTVPASGVTYSFDNGVTFQTDATSGDLSPATYKVVVKNTTGCKSPAADVTLNAVSSTPSAPVTSVTQPSCTTATGTITVTSPTSGVTYSFDNGATYQASATSGNLPANSTYKVVVKNAAGCVSPASDATLNAQPATPPAPAADAIQPDCFTATGTITVTAPSSGVEYSFDNGASFQASPINGNLSANTYQVIVKNITGGCESAATPVTIDPQPITPLPPTTSIVQPDCVIPTGTITVITPASGVEYSFDNGANFQTISTSGDLIANTYQVVVRSIVGGCVSAATPATIDPQPTIPGTAITNTTQPDCTTPTGTITVTSPASGVTYSFDNGANFQASATSGNLIPNTYNVVVKNTIGGCVSVATPVKIDPQPTVPGTPILSTTQPDCTTATGTITVTSPTSGVTYSFDNGVSFQTSPTLSNLPANNYQVLVKSTAGGCVSLAAGTTIDPQPTLPNAPAVISLVSYCQGATASSLSATGDNLTWYTTATGSNGSPVAPTPSTDEGGSTTYYVSASNGTCEGPRSSITVTVIAVSANAGGPEVRMLEGSSVVLNGTAEGENATILWSPNNAINNRNIEDPTVSPLKTQVYTMKVTAGNCSATDNVNVIVLKDLIIPTIFSPNDDGYNDKWYIKNMNQYPNSEVTIFNRYGQIIFESKGYGVPWDGNFKGKPEPVGAYFYIIKKDTNGGVITGSISIVR